MPHVPAICATIPPRGAVKADTMVMKYFCWVHKGFWNHSCPNKQFFFLVSERIRIDEALPEKCLVLMVTAQNQRGQYADTCVF